MSIYGTDRQYQNLVDNFHDIIMECDHNSGILYVNRAWSVNLGYTDQDTVGSHINRFLHPEDRNYWIRHVAVYRGGFSHRSYTIRLKRITGNYHYYKVTIQPQKNERIIFSISKDSQDIIETEYNHNRISKFYQASSEGIIFHEDGIILDLNNNVKSLLGYDAFELIGHSLTKFVNPESIDGINSLITETVEKPITLSLQKKDGTKFTTEAHSKRVRIGNNDKNIISLQLINKSIKALSQTYVAEENLLKLIPGSEEGILVCSQQKYVFANQPAIKILGYSLEELCELQLKDLICSNNYAEIIAPYKGSIPNHIVISDFKTSLKRKTGDFLPITLTSRTTTWNGNPASLYIFRSIENEIIDANFENHKQLFSTVFKSINDAIVLLDLNRRIVFGNPAFYLLFQYSPNDLNGKHFSHLYEISTDFVKQEPHIFTSFLGKDKITNIAHMQRKNTEAFSAEINNSTIYGTDGEPAGYLCIIRNFSNRSASCVALSSQKQPQSSDRLEFESIGMALISANKHWIDCNQRHCDILGYTREELINLSWYDITHPDDLAAETEHYNRVLLNRSDGYSLEKRFIAKDGGLISTFTSTKCIRNKNGIVEYFIILVYDTSNGSSVSHRFFSDFTNFKNTVSHVSNVVYHCDSDFSVSYISDSIESLSGYPHCDFLNHPLHTDPRIYSTQDIDLLRKKINGLDKNNSSFFLEHKIIHHDKSFRWVYEMGIAQFDEENKLREIFGVIADIDDVKNSQDVLRNIQEQRDRFFSLSFEMLCILSFRGIFTDLSNAWERSLGFTINEMKAKPLIEFIHPEDQKNTIAFMDRLKTHKDSNLNFTNRLKCKNNKYIWVLWNSVAMHERDEIYAVVHDISELKKAEVKIHNHQKQIENLVSKRTANVNEQAQIINQTHNSIISTDMEGIIISWNTGSEKLFGHNAKESIGRHLTFVYAEEEQKTFNHNVFMPLLMNGGLEAEIQMLRKNTDRFVAFVSLSLRRDENGVAQGLIQYAMDITQKKQAEIAIRESEKKYRLLIDNAGIPIIFISLDGTILLINEIGARNFGGLPSDFIGKTMYKLLPEVAYSYMMKMQQIVTTGKGLTFEDKINLPTESRWFSFNLQPMRDSKGKIFSLQIVAHDVTERKLAEERLIISEQQYRDLYENAPLAYCTIDIKTDSIVRHNKAMASFLGYDNKELNTIKFITLFAQTPFGREKARWSYKIICSNKKAVETELQMLHKNGKIIWVLVSITPVIDDHGNVIKTRSIVRDISEKKQSEEAIRDSEARWRSLTENSPDHILTLDKNLRILFANYSLPGHTLENMIGTQIYKYVKNNMQESIKNLLLEVLATSNPNSYETIYESENDKNLFYETRVSPRIISNEVVGLTLSVRDITLRKKTEREFIKAKVEAENANQAKSEFLSRMSHELRTPMNAILGFTQLLEIEEPLTPTQKDSVHEIYKAGRHLLELINEVLDLSKIESGRIDLSLTTINCSLILRECIDLIAPLARDREIIIEHEIHRNKNYTVRGDDTRLKQVILNLLSNAVKYNRKRGSVKIKSIDLANKIRLEISDTGFGIPPERQNELFKPFSRLDANQINIEGSGIGLVISKRLIEAMAGKIGMRSTLGIGSTFWIELPKENVFSVPKVKNQLFALESKGNENKEMSKILYIEDNPVNLRLVSQLLLKHNYIQLYTASNPNDGLKLAHLHQPNLIMLDINLPQMDGYQVISKLKTDSLTKEIPVIAISANAMPQDIDKSQQAGFEDYLTKPIDVHRLYTIIDKFTHAKLN